jgi:hypothetical protein
MLYNINIARVECKNKCDISKNWGNWNHFKIIQKIFDQQSGKALNQGTTKNSHIGHCARTSESTNIKYNTVDITLETALYAP